MSPRTLTRRFRAAAGIPPGEWLQRERLRLAQRLLETTDAADRGGRAPCRVRLGGDDARAVRAPAAHLAARLPRDVPRERRGVNVVDQDGARPDPVGD